MVLSAEKGDDAISVSAPVFVLIEYPYTCAGRMGDWGDTYTNGDPCPAAVRAFSGPPVSGEGGPAIDNGAPSAPVLESTEKLSSWLDCKLGSPAAIKKVCCGGGGQLLHSRELEPQAVNAKDKQRQNKTPKPRRTGLARTRSPARSAFIEISQQL
jgi:hypothetical protein